MREGKALCVLNKNYPSKVILIGEYTLLNGSRALALPFDGYLGKWCLDQTTSDAAQISRESLQSFFDSSSDLYIDRRRLQQDLNEGLWFDSNIPHGYGLGSSGALIAAIFDRYGLKKRSTLENRSVLAKLEDFFHGASSGLDPMVSYVNAPILIHSFDQVEVLNQRPDLNGFFLLNTGRPRQTGPLISIYKEKLKDHAFMKECANVLQRDVNFAIEALIHGDKEHLFHHLWHISKFQLEFFSEMIPIDTRKVWTTGLETGDYILKLCGAGGGGFLLGYNKRMEQEKLHSILRPFELKDLK